MITLLSRLPSLPSRVAIVAHLAAEVEGLAGLFVDQREVEIGPVVVEIGVDGELDVGGRGR